jgi:hypothetical protein
MDGFLAMFTQNPNNFRAAEATSKNSPHIMEEKKAH